MIILSGNITVAVLDESGVYQGLMEIAATAFNPERHVDAQEFGGDCDLPPGRYRWSAMRKRFDPIAVDEVNQRLRAHRS